MIIDTNLQWRGWRSAIRAGAIIVALLACALVERGREHGRTVSLASAVRNYDSTTHIMKAAVARERSVAASAAAVESRAESHAAAIRQALVVAPPPVAVDPRIDEILAAQDTALGQAHVEIAALDTALDLTELRATESDSLLHLAVREDGARCRIAWVLPCPSRLVAAALGAAAVVAVVLR